ncbi:MAG: hypothetical protein WEB63_02140 [Cucumibacter sp.]
MSDLRTLRELAELASQAAPGLERRISAASRGMATAGLRPARPRVAELLSLVMILSARTRRIGREPVDIDLDVFAPDGRRAVRMNFRG